MGIRTTFYGMSMNFNPQAIQSYIDGQDRQSPLFFTGRQDEIDMAHRVLRNLQAGRPEGKTLVFQGAPGAGKTALLNHLREALRGECDTAELDSAQINRPHIALLEVLQEIEPDKADEIKRSYQHTFKGRCEGGRRRGRVLCDNHTIAGSIHRPRTDEAAGRTKQAAALVP